MAAEIRRRFGRELIAGGRERRCPALVAVHHVLQCRCPLRSPRLRDSRGGCLHRIDAGQALVSNLHDSWHIDHNIACAWTLPAQLYHDLARLLAEKDRIAPPPERLGDLPRQADKIPFATYEALRAPHVRDQVATGKLMSMIISRAITCPACIRDGIAIWITTPTWLSRTRVTRGRSVPYAGRSPGIRRRGLRRSARKSYDRLFLDFSQLDAELLSR